MITIKLRGELADFFTPEIIVDVSSVAEAIAALKANFQGFANYLYEAANQGVNYQIKVGYDDISEEHLRSPIADKVQTITISPVIAGAGTVGRIIAGVALIGLAASGIGFAFLGLQTALTIGLIGGALLVSGISSIFNRQANRESLVFGGTSTTVKEGGRVPIIYGVALVGMYLISAKITSYYHSF